MKQASNYGLTLWEKTDRIQMEDFNADNATWEQALTALAEAQSDMAATLASCGTVRRKQNRMPLRSITGSQ